MCKMKCLCLHHTPSSTDETPQCHGHVLPGTTVTQSLHNPFLEPCMGLTHDRIACERCHPERLPEKSYVG